MNTWPDGGMTPFRNEKNSNWEGAFRIPLLVRWPGKIPAGVVVNDIVQDHDWLPTFLAAAGEPDIVEKLKKGYKAGDKTFKVHIDGYNLLPFLTTKGERSPRKGFMYFSGAARAGNVGGLGRTVRGAAAAEAVQPADGPVPASGHHIEQVLSVVARERLSRDGGLGGRERVHEDVQGLPPAAEGGQLHD